MLCLFCKRFIHARRGFIHEETSQQSLFVAKRAPRICHDAGRVRHIERGRRAKCQYTAESDKPSATVSGEESVTLKFWTWHPSADLYKPVIEKFEETHPGIKVELTVMESKDFQTKMPMALSTQEDLDVVGVQTGAMPKQIQADLLPLEELLSEARPDWQSVINENSVAQAKSQADSLKFLPMASVGSMVMYYNKDILNELGLRHRKPTRS